VCWWASVHGLPVKLPGPPDPKVTVPLGVVWPLPAVSVTVAVHVEGFPTATVPVQQATLVEVGSYGDEKIAWNARSS
jgi:hypothetical protein